MEIWNLGQKAAKANKLPSECLPGLVDEIGDWGCWCVDNAVYWLVGVIEAALAETEPIGVKPHIEQRQKYTLDQLLDDAFRLPNPKEKRRQTGKELSAMFGHKRKQKRKATLQGFDLPPTIAVQYEAMLARKGQAL